MPVNKKDALFRLWKTLQCIPRHPCMRTAGHILDNLKDEGYDITLRTVQRDLSALSRIFPIESEERDEDGSLGWYWAKGAANIDIPALTDSQALAFKMVEQHLSTMLPPSYLDQLRPYLAIANQKLKGPGSHLLSRCWTDKVRVLQLASSHIPPAMDAEIQDTVLDALLRERRIRITCRDEMTKVLTDYVVHPYGLVQYLSVLHLIACVEGEKNPRSFKLHRICQADAIDLRAARPKNFDIDHFLFPGQKKRKDDVLVKYECYVTHEVAERLIDLPLSKDQVITYEANDRARVKATVPRCVKENLEGIKPEGGVIGNINFDLGYLLAEPGILVPDALDPFSETWRTPVASN